MEALSGRASSGSISDAARRWLGFPGRVGADRIHRISGKPVDMAPVAYRIAWLLRNEPGHFRAASMFCDVHAYLTWKLTGAFRTSWASADPLGLFDLEAKKWSGEILEALALSQEQLPAAFAPGTVLGEVTVEAASVTGLAAGTLVVAGGGDGQAAGLGVNALASERAYLNLGTAVVGGVYTARYGIDSAWRTMGSCSGEGYYCETSLRTGTFLVDWFVKNVCGAEASDEAIYKRLEEEAEAAPVGSHGLLLVPYWGAVMTPYWDQRARGAMIGFTGAHNRGEMYRSLLEGVALEQELVNSMIEERAGVRVHEYIAIGGGAASSLWRRIIADVSGKTVKLSQTVEASSLGAGMCAAVAAGWFPTMAEAAEAMSSATTSEIEPGPLPRGALCRVARHLPRGLSADSGDLPPAQPVLRSRIRRRGVGEVGYGIDTRAIHPAASATRRKTVTVAIDAAGGSM